MLPYTQPIGRCLNLPTLRSLPAAGISAFQKRAGQHQCCSQQADKDACTESTKVLNTLRKGFAPQKRPQQKPEPSHPTDAASAASVKEQLAQSVYSDAWKEVDKKVNTYPAIRIFTAVGLDSMDMPSMSASSSDEAAGSSGAEPVSLPSSSFQASIRAAVESVLGPVADAAVSTRPSSQGKYLSVKIGPVRVEHAEQVVQVFANIRKDPRMKFYL